MLYLDMQKTKTKMKCAQILTHLPLLLVLILASANLTASRSSCPSHCGNTSIPYPFGIGKGCYLNEWFAIQCNNSTSGDLVPYLPKINNEVVKISLPDSTGFFKTTESYGSLRIKTNITSMGCSNSSDETKFGDPLNFTGTPFTVGRSNIFKAIGCNYKATLTHLDPTFVGCISTCEPRKIGEHTSCRGYKCCQVDPPSEIGQVVGINMEEISSNITRERGCRVAFLTGETQDPLASREAQVTDPEWFYDRQYVTIQLRWAIQMTNLSFINSLGCTMGYLNSSINPCICVNNTNDRISSVGCACHKGYTGNPYILGGCKDIDECQLDKGNYENCRPQGGTCVNTQGSYQCVFKKYKTMPVTMGLCVGFGVLMMVFAVAFLLCKFIKKQRKVIGKRKLFRRNGGLLLKQQLTSAEGSIEKTRVFTSKELKKATENFSSTRVLGKGGQGTVYKGMLVDGRIVAVKKSTVVDQDKVGEFINEVVILSQINHRNIVKLIGCCLETEVPLLVYEFVSNGNLFEHLHGEFDESALTTWEMRLRIIIDIAGALSYLHSSASSPIFHRDVKSTNIMLDEKYRVKVSDFGTSRWVTDDHTHLTTVVSGTVGYVDPEYFQTSQFTDKSDVYSFGVVLVELITGEKPISFVRFLKNRTLAAYFILAMEENRLVDIIDSQIREDCNLEQVMAAAQLARRCLKLTGKDRPSMREVSMELERIRSPTKDLQSNVHIVKNKADEADIGVESCNKVAVSASWGFQYNVDTTSTVDAEPLFPSQTW